MTRHRLLQCRQSYPVGDVLREMLSLVLVISGTVAENQLALGWDSPMPIHSGDYGLRH